MKTHRRDLQADALGAMADAFNKLVPNPGMAAAISDMSKAINPRKIEGTIEMESTLTYDVFTVAAANERFRTRNHITAASTLDGAQRLLNDTYEERDRARATAVRLEQELARATGDLVMFADWLDTAATYAAWRANRGLPDHYTVSTVMRRASTRIREILGVVA